ncbi:MAG: aldehyde dehydrogenase family protein [Pseudomonadota bacterium]
MYKMLINGALVGADKKLSVINPADETVAATVPDAGPEHVDAAVAAASHAYAGGWRQTSHAQRKAVLNAIAAVIRENSEELAELLIRETGRPMALAQYELGLATQYLDYYAEQTLDVEILSDSAERRVELHRKPLGVVAAIVPWNAPLFIAVGKIAPALIAGNTIVVKPAPTTPLATLRLGELIAAAVPAGVVNIVSGGNDAGARLVTHADVAKVTFTGSTQTGRAIMALVAPTLKRLTLELGGNDAAIVLPDADPKAIAPALFGLAFFNSGQVCAIIKRLYVHDSLYDAVCDEIAALANSAVVGNGADAATQFGPVQNRAQYDKVLGFLDDARANGRIIAGGGRLAGPGYFVPLTVVRDIAEGTMTVDEEPFGPILPIIRYSEVDDVIARANRSPYGLGASVWSGNPEQAAQIASRIESGSVWVNQHCALDPAVPFPAHKQSGLGVEAGREGLLAYTALQVLNVSKL